MLFPIHVKKTEESGKRKIGEVRLKGGRRGESSSSLSLKNNALF